MSIHAVVLTLSPVVAIGWTVLLFGITPSAQQIVGGTAVIGGILLVTLGKVNRKGSVA